MRIHALAFHHICILQIKEGRVYPGGARCTERNGKEWPDDVKVPDVRIQTCRISYGSNKKVVKKMQGT